MKTLAMEMRKFTSVRAGWFMLVGLALYMVFIVAVIAATFVYSEVSDTQIVQLAYGMGSPAGYVFPLIIGSWLVTQDFRHGTIVTTFLAEPRRSRVLIAKFGAGLVAGVIVAAVTVLVSAATGGIAFGVFGDETYLTNPDVLKTLAGTFAAMILWTLLGVAVGTVITNQVVAIVLILAFTQFVEPLARLSLTAFESVDFLANVFPSSGTDALVGVNIFAQGVSGSLEAWQGALVVLAWIVVLGLLGRVTSFAADRS